MGKIVCPRCGRANSEYDVQCMGCGNKMPLDSLRTRHTESEMERISVLAETTRSTSAKTGEKAAITGKLGHFEILEGIGQGGMGTVYKAHDPHLDRFVAIKVMRRDMEGSDGERSNLLKEARTASSLNHPNIITIHDISRGEDADYMVMEWVDGQSLSSIIPPSGLPEDAVTRYALRIADGLARAHRAGIIHRDIKPANIMVTEADKIKILDFGLARMSAGAVAGPGGSIDETLPGTIKGTVAYMSPEQTLGLPLDSRTDIFSFGALLYRAISGHRPFRKRYARDLAAAIRESEPRPLTEIVPGISRSLAELIHRCLAKNPEDRPQAMEEVVVELERLQKQAEYTETGLSPRKRPLIGTGLLSAAIIGAVFFFPYKNREPRPVEKLAVLPFTNISGDPLLQVFCDGLASDLSNKLARLESFRPGTWIVPVDEVSRLGRPSSKDLHDRYGVDRVLSGSIEHLGANRRLTLTLLDAGQIRQIASKTLELPAGQLFDAHRDILANAVELLGQRLDEEDRSRIFGERTPVSGSYRDYLQGIGFLYRYDQRDSLAHALTAFQNALEKDPEYIDALLGIVRAYLRLWQENAERSWLENAQTFLEKAGRLRPDHPEVNVAKGFLQLAKGAPMAAESAFRPVWLAYPGHPNAGQGLAHALAEQGKDEEAQKVFLETLEKRPNDWTIYNRLSSFYFRRGLYEKAGDIDRKLIEMTPNNMLGYYSLAEVLRIQGDLDGALANLDLALQHVQTGSALMTANAFTNKAVILFFQGRFDEAVEPFEKAADATPNRYRVWLNLADGYRWSSSKKDRADPAYEKARHIIRERQKVYPDSVRLKAEAALCLAKTGKPSEGLAALEDVPIPSNPYLIVKWATIAELAGEREKALQFLEPALRANLPIQDIWNDPEFGSLRDDPGFELLLEKLGIDNASVSTK